MQESLMNQGIELMIFGMGTVFAFLTLLVILTAVMSLVVRKLAPETTPVKPAAAAQPTSAIDDPQLVAVITAAIEAHRANHK